MPEELNFTLKNAGSLTYTPQEGLSSISSDTSSVFGNYDYNKEVKNISFNTNEENPYTPFTYNSVIGNIFNSSAPEAEDFKGNQDIFEDFNYPKSTLEFEC